MQLAVTSLEDDANRCGLPFVEASDWYLQVSGGRWEPSFHFLPKVTLPQPSGWYLGGFRGKGPPPANSQSLARDLWDGLRARAGIAEIVGETDSRLVIVVPAAFAAHTWDLPRGESTGQGSSRLRYAILPKESPLGTLVHELGHLALDWPDLVWSSPDADECLMARGASRAGGREPAPPCAPLLVRAGWRDVVPLTRGLTVGELTPDRVARLEYADWEVLTEKRTHGGSRILAYRSRPRTRCPAPDLFERLTLSPEDSDRSLLGLLAPSLRLKLGSSRLACS